MTDSHASPSEQTLRTVGVLGTGIMGAPMASRLAAAGHRVRAWNRTPDKLIPLQQAGVEAVSSATAAARGADVVIVMLSAGPVCDEILLGDDGVIAAMSPDSILVVMSSIPVDTARHQATIAARHGIGYLDAPVSGGERGAIDGTLAIMAGGEAAVFDSCQTLLQNFGRPTHVGPAGSGQLAKLANQMIVANTIATVAEALLLAERGGADPAQVRMALMGGFADSTILKMHGQRMLEEDFAPGGAAKWQYKDTQTAIAEMNRLGLDLPVSRQADALFGDMLSHGDGELDHSGLIRELRRRNGMPVD
ncbi:2-hydroxy-3-oxopropionate reductase [Salinicola sp. MH3R3-1]|uniref:NAD(P)-dependent oxidoreductase n=1 Tax=Salinicola sp. MH3R3-1 TaxID=1928762 RepID=UPI00094ED929|nr:NAD(P)-dependent oxidoreductase [Salinicola sp. MH3R3-1]OLO06744.1 2-hydroxy-3-oxopropionate reductase [Salinicola sp. MH3R3-1]